MKSYFIYYNKCMSNLAFRRRHYHNSPKAGLIYLDSSYEMKAALLLDNDTNVLSYKNQVKFSGNSGKGRRIDFLVNYNNGVKIIEVKPIRRLINFEQQLNDNKIYAEQQGYKFEIWTEKELGFTNEWYAKKWADEYLSKVEKIDLVKLRLERGNDRSKKHYREKIIKNKIKYWCEHCQEFHEQLELTYERNKAKGNDPYCPIKSGKEVGKLPYIDKNPYKDIGKKQCNKCLKILPLDKFSKGKGQCKTCRAAVYKERYNNSFTI